MNIRPIALCLAAALMFSRAQAQAPLKAEPAAWESRGCVDDARGQWFRDAKFGAFIHFGPYSSLGGYYEGKGPIDPAEQIIGLGERHAKIPAGEYREKVAGHFNPEKFDAEKWVSAIRRAGQKYVILTTKHHDGFCMFATRTTSYNVVEATPFKRDVVQELAEECRRQGIVFCVYYSIGDWCATDVWNPGFATYADYMRAQLRELLTNYGEIKMLWFDNWWYVNDQWKNDEAHARDLYEFSRSVNPNMLVNDRCGRGAKSEDGDYGTPENQLKGSLQSRYFEVVMTNTDDDNWGWVKGSTNYRKAGDLIRNLIDSVSKGGNFVLNVGPNADGEFPPEHAALLEQIGSWTRANGEAIYGTVPAATEKISGDADTTCYATASRDSKAMYLHVIKWPAAGKSLEVVLKGDRTPRATFLDKSLAGESVGYVCKVAAGATTITIKTPKQIDPYATVIKLSFP